MNRNRLLLCALIGIAAAAAPATWKLPIRIVYNPSASAPLGWYSVHADASPQVGDYVLAALPPDAATLADQRGYLPKQVPVLKQVRAVAGQSACVRGAAVLVDGRRIGSVLSADRRGRPLPAWHDCRRLADGELFLYGAASAASFDSRYFGPVQVSDVRGIAVPLWTWSAP